MSTLYVSDLDGTLLRSDQRTSGYTNRTINALVEQGVCFSYATARSYHTAHKVTEGLTAAFPLIIYNGACIRDNETGKRLLKNQFPPGEGERMVREMLSREIYPIVYAFFGEKEQYSYLPHKNNRATMEFLAPKRQDERDRPVESPERLLEGEIFYLTCIGEPEKLKPVWEMYRDKYHCIYQQDLYSGEQWLEIIPKETSKANAIRQLASMLGCDYIVAFGDGINDIDMFELADEAYAVENAVPELKVKATGVIGSNNDDGVAKWLQDHVTVSQKP